MATDTRYNELTAESLPLERANLKDMLEQQVNNPRKTGQGPWRIDAPSRRVRECPITMWIYNVGPRNVPISALPGMPNVLPAAPEGHEYGVPLPIREITLDYAGLGDYKLKAVEVDDIDLAGPIVCPSCNGRGASCKESHDLRRWGVFYSHSNPPKESELATARRQLGDTFSDLIKIADSLWEDPKKRWQVEGANGNNYRMAAKYKKIERPWCTLLADMVSCPGCGGTNSKGAMVCSQGTCGIVLDYDKALKFGKISQDQFDEAVERGLWIEGKGFAV